ncbi:MAG: hypothetical protein IPL32_04375 [Chloracidobacterium sp.]|nr:hypothetical protein [Chloracidobacterium sp.]
MKSKKAYCSMIVLLVVLAFGFVSITDTLAQTQTNIIGPAGSELFGTQVLTLANGNFVVTDYFYDSGALSNVGAVYLYNGATKELISTLTGNLAGNRVGLGGVVGLANGNFLVLSPEWDRTGVSNGGAITFCSGVTGCQGNVTTTNSLVGAVTDDLFSSRIYTLPNGKYIVVAQFWNNGAIANAGMAMLCDGTVGCTGEILPANALVGSTANDEVGEQVTILPNGSYVVHSDGWQNAGADNAGAVTLCDSITGCAGMAVSPANSLVGSTTGDAIGGSVNTTILTNGNFVIRSPVWDNGAVSNAGAVTLCNGTTGCAGVVSPATSRVGSTASDSVGTLASIIPLTNGNFVIRIPDWNNGATADVGAVSFCNGTVPCTGAVSASNSLIGSTANDQVGNISTSAIPVALPNGNYVVGSGAWDNGAVMNAGATTLCNGTTGCSGPVTTTNSLVGTTAVDTVGASPIVALSNSNFVVPTRLWNNGATADVGAVTFCDAVTGCAGQQVSAANSLIGTVASDQVGSGGVQALTNGKYIVGSPLWAANNIGAVTLCSGTTGCTGISPSAANSLFGSTASDGVGGGGGIHALANGNYVVRTSQWDRAAILNAGAVTFCSGSTGCIGTISLANSLVGSTANDSVGGSSMNIIPFTALPNGDYIAISTEWDNGPADAAGAVTFCSGTTGCVGAVSAANSLVGSTTGDVIGSVFTGFTTLGVTVFPQGNFVVQSSAWDNGAFTDAGAASFGDGISPLAGTINNTNSVLGTSTGGGSTINVQFDVVNNQYIVGRQQDNIVTVFQPDGGSTPTATNTPTATSTPTNTPTGTQTPSPTPTPCPTINSALDPTFDGDGKVTTPILSASDNAKALAIQPDGKIVAAGSAFGANNDFAVARYNPNGSLDTTFDGDGKVTTAVGAGSDEAYAVAIQADGKIVAAGYSSNGFAVVRYNTNGSLDTTFDGDGIVTTEFGISFADVVEHILIQSDGKIVAAGYSDGGSDFAVARYNTNGSLDTTFDGDGKVTTAIGTSDDIGRSAALQTDGKIVVAGSTSTGGTNSDFALVRYNTNGSLDTSFDGDGKVTTPTGAGTGGATSVKIQTDGKIVAVGNAGDGSFESVDFAAIRYNTNGSLDTTFDGDGKVITPVGTTADYANSVVLQSDGKIVTVGSVVIDPGGDWDFGAVRHNTNGSLDSTFDGDGKVTTAFGTNTDEALAVAIQPDGKIVAAGYRFDGANSDFALVRYGDCSAGGTPTNTPTATSTNTSTPTSTPTAAVTPSISGTVTYGNAIGAPTPRFVSNVTITGTGSPNVVTTTAAPGASAGQYTLTGFGAGSYTVTPTKTSGSNSITSFDAARISQHVAGPPNTPLTGNQLVVADVSGNSVVSSFDAAMIAKFVAGPPYVAPGIGSTSTWRFTPTNRNYASVTSSISGEDFSALLMGEVSGNWNNTGARPAGTVNSGQSIVDSDDNCGEAEPITITAQQVLTAAEKEIVVPVTVEGIADKGVISFEFDLRYDPSVMQPLVEAVDVSGTVSHGLSVVTNAMEPGLLRVVVYGAYPIDGDGVLLNLRFTSVGAVGSMSPISFGRIMFNEGESRVLVTDGKVELF